MSLAKLTVIGHLGRNPEMKDSTNGDKVCNFALAVNERIKDKSGELVDNVQWFNVHVYTRQMEACMKWLQKGSQVYVEGRMKLRTYEGRDGKTKASIDLTASQVKFLTNPNDVPQELKNDKAVTKSNDNSKFGGTNFSQGPSMYDDEIPF